MTQKYTHSKESKDLATKNHLQDLIGVYTPIQNILKFSQIDENGCKMAVPQKNTSCERGIASAARAPNEVPF